MHIVWNSGSVLAFFSENKTNKTKIDSICCMITSKEVYKTVTEGLAFRHIILKENTKNNLFFIIEAALPNGCKTEIFYVLLLLYHKIASKNLLFSGFWFY